MALIKDRKHTADLWKLLEAGAEGEATFDKLGTESAQDVIVPLSVWRAQREALLARSGRLGVWLAGEHDPGEIAQDLAHFQVIAVHFKTFNDGRGYSTGQLLRRRYGWQGELRAIGEVRRDHLMYLVRCGFDAFALPDDEDLEVALTAFGDFSESYQASIDQPLPLFRRRETARQGA